MTARTRLVLAGASVALLVVYVAPIWSISLEAPQYPEGIGMYIWVDTITGHEPQDLQNINGLNHYIGMGAITPESIPELDIMPWIMALLAALGLAAAAAGKRVMLFVWVALFLATAVIGMVDFYRWEYNFGHNLDPTAAIKVPGMHYQPPLIGAKRLLNFTAHSWPATGGWVVVMSVITGLVLAIREAGMTIRRKKGYSGGSNPDMSPDGRAKQLCTLVPALLILAACTPEPQPLIHGLDRCTFCRMTVSDERYGGKIVTAKGKVYPFDSVECLSAFRLSGRISDENFQSSWVADFADAPNLIPTDSAFYLHSRDLPSPMGMDLTAFGKGISRQAVLHAFHGNVLDWSGVDSLVRLNMLSDSTGSALTTAAPQPKN